MSILKKNGLIEELVRDHIEFLAQRESLEPSTIRGEVDQGRMVLLTNPSHAGVTPTLVGNPSSIKVNANIGTSPFMEDPELELRKLDTAVRAGAHTIMDLSIGGDLDRIRERILTGCNVPVGTVPIYSVAQKYISRGKDPSRMSAEELLEEIEHQAGQGVDFMTVHCGVTRRAAELGSTGKRLLGIVSRGGSLLTKWMQENNRENPLYEHFDRILEIAARHNVVLSLGDGMRPGAGPDAGDPAQWEEVVVLGELTTRAWEAGVQVMIEGPGHVPLHLVQSQIQGIKQLTRQAPLYVLGPLPTDIAAGYDHIAGAIGGAMAGFFGADFLCYLTPAEHLTLPGEDDVHKGVKASLLAAHAAEVALGRPSSVERNKAISKARAELDWASIQEHALDPDLVAERRKDFQHKEECAMCGEFCAVKLLR